MQARHPALFQVVPFASLYGGEYRLNRPLGANTRRWGPGERLVFKPYTEEAHTQTFDWITRHGIFAEGGMADGRYEDSVISLQGAERARRRNSGG
jgi:NitT/TauT family transport system substrate-binding protein